MDSWGDLFTRSQTIISETVFPVNSLEIELSLSGPASIMGITSLDKAVDNVSRFHGKVKEELTVTKRLRGSG
jgi:hypothetical protein